MSLLPAAAFDRAVGYTALFLVGWSPLLWSLGYLQLSSAGFPPEEQSELQSKSNHDASGVYDKYSQGMTTTHAKPDHALRQQIYGSCKGSDGVDGCPNFPGNLSACRRYTATLCGVLWSSSAHCPTLSTTRVTSACPRASAPVLLPPISASQIGKDAPRQVIAVLAAESKAANRFGANFEATDVDDEMSTARIALATGAGLKRESSPQRRAVEGTEAGRKVFRDLRRAYMRVCGGSPCEHHCTRPGPYMLELHTTWP